MQLTKVVLLGLATTLATACYDAPTAPTGAQASRAKAPARAASMDACKNGGYRDWTRTDGSSFTNQGACVSYTAQGGTLVPSGTTPTITSFTGEIDCNANPQFWITATFANGTGEVFTAGGTSLGPVESGVRSPLFVFSYEGYRLVVTSPTGATTSATFAFSGVSPAGDTGCPAPVRKARWISAGR